MAAEDEISVKHDQLAPVYMPSFAYFAAFPANLYE